MKHRIYSLSPIIFVISFGATLPQLYQTLKTGLTRDLNLVNLFLNLLTNILLGIHGYITEDIGITAIGVWFSFYWAVLLGLKGYNQKQGEE
jgi:uncharacterized protein with PQ loop repeat